MPCCILCCLPAMPLSLARPASEFQNRLVQTAVDPFTDGIVCRVTKISPARVASGLQSTKKKTNPLTPLATLAGLILVTRHTMRLVNRSTAVWTSVFWNSEAGRARDKGIASERSVGGIANRENGHGTATSLLWISGGIEARGNFPAELFASSDGHSGNHCSALSFF